MKLLLWCVTLLLLALVPLSTAQQTPVAQRGGVKDNTTWKNNSSKKVTVKVTAQTNGNLKVEYTDKDGKTGSTTSGTPAVGGGVSESPAVAVGNDEYRIKKGRVQWKNAAGLWVDMYEGTGSGGGTGFSDRAPVLTLP
jgi:hypothetical protein